MKKLNCLILLIGILVFTIPVFSVDARWISSITIRPAVVRTGVLASAEAELGVFGIAGIDNLRVIGGAEDDIMYDRTFAHIDGGDTRRASFEGTPSDPGTFTVFFQIDPDSTSPDSDRTNNRIEVSLRITPGFMPNLVNIAPSPTWTPAEFIAGEILTIHYTVGNTGDAAGRDFQVCLKVAGATIARNSHPGLAVGAPAVEGSFTWPVVCGADVSIVIDCGNDVSESNETDNVASNPAMSTCAVPHGLPNLTVEKLKIDSGSSTISEHAALYYRGKVRVSGDSVTNVKVRAGIVGGAVLYDNTFPIIEMDSERNIEFKANLKKGLYTLYIEADPDNTIVESNERDNRATSKFIVVGKEGSPIAPKLSSK